MAPFEKYLLEVNQRFIQAGKSVSLEKKLLHLQYLKSGRQHQGLTGPQQRILFKKPYSFSKLPIKEQLPIWDFIWNNTTIFEPSMQALYFAELHQAHQNGLLYWETIQNWVEKIDCWPHSDLLCKIYAEHLELFPETVLEKLKQWNISENPWSQRCSIVSLLYYSRLRKSHLDFEIMIPLVHPLIESPHVYVQKGIGWTLREIYNLYPTQTTNYINQNLLLLSPIAFTTSTEKIDTILKTKWKAYRKKNRLTRKNT